MIKSNIISKILKKNIIHNYNYLINKIYNVIVKTFMNNIAVLKKKNYIYFVNLKNLNNYLTKNFNKNIIKRIISLPIKVRMKFV